MNDATIQRWMEQEARRIVVWIPTNMKNETEIKVFTEKVKVFLEKTAMSQTELAARIGISSTTLNQFLNGKYPGDNEAVVRKLADYINRMGRRERRSKEPDYVETAVAKRILSAIRVTEQFTTPHEGRICLIVGDAGHGKSKCLEQYAAATPNAIYIKLCDKMSTIALMSRLATALNLDAAGGLKKLVDDLLAYLGKREMTIILDEAAGLDVGRLNLLRQVVVECGCTLVLAGNTHLVKTINDSSVKRGNECLDQFRSRMLTSLNLDESAGLSPDDGGLYSVEDIRRLYAAGGIKLSGDAEGLLLSIARCPQTGRLRTCSVIVASINSSRQARDGQIAEITEALILDTIHHLGLCVQPYLPMVIAAAGKQDAAETKTKTA